MDLIVIQNEFMFELRCVFFCPGFSMASIAGHFGYSRSGFKTILLGLDDLEVPSWIGNPKHGQFFRHWFAFQNIADWNGVQPDAHIFFVAEVHVFMLAQIIRPGEFTPTRT